MTAAQVKEPEPAPSLDREALLEAALDYARRGLAVCPLHWPENGGCSCKEKAKCGTPGKHPRWHEVDLPHGANSATTDEKIIRQWWQRWPQANIGIATGQISDLIVVDIDPRNGGDKSLKKLPGNLPFTPTSRTGGKGEHYLLKHPGNGCEIANDIGFAGYTGIDLKSDGGLIVAPPSRHISGEDYYWKINLDTPLAPTPNWLLELIKKESTPERKAEPVGEVIPGGERVKTLRSLAGTMRKRGMNEPAILAALEAINQTQCETPLPDSKIKDIAKSYGKYAPGEITAKGTAPAPQTIDRGLRLTDLGAAERVVALHGQGLRYCYPWKKWLVNDGRRWAIDDTGRVYRCAKNVAPALYAEAATAKDKDERKALAQFAMKCEAAEQQRAFLTSAQSEPGIPILPEHLDIDPWLFNVLNGTIDLKTGTLHPHRQENLITKMAPVEFDPLATCPTWIKFLNRILAGNPDLINFLQKAVGYSLTGIIWEQVLFFLWGLGANGKSTLLDILQQLLGDYATRTSSETFLSKKPGGIPNDVAALRGARLVAAVEVEQGRRLAEVLIKEMTGGDTIAARFLHAEWFNFRPQFKIFLATNHKPVIRGTDHAIWRRIRLLPFTVQIPLEEQDRELPGKLKLELPGILNWAIAGCLQWRHGGLEPPKEVNEATQAYRDEMDILADFIAERCLVAPAVSATAKELYSAYTAWAEAAGEKQPLSQRAFGMSLTERGFKRDRGTGGRIVWYGIGLKKGE